MRIQSLQQVYLQKDDVLCRFLLNTLGLFLCMLVMKVVHTQKTALGICMLVTFFLEAFVPCFSGRKLNFYNQLQSIKSGKGRAMHLIQPVLSTLLLVADLRGMKSLLH